jgi:hypothetical protein
VVGEAGDTFATPTGTVTLTVSVSGGQTYTIGTATLVPLTGVPNATATFVFGILPVGTYTLTETYNGDSNYSSASGISSSFIVTLSPVPDLVSGTSSCSCAGPVTAPRGSGDAVPGNTSVSGVDPATGAVSIVRSDLSSGGLEQHSVRRGTGPTPAPIRTGLPATERLPLRCRICMR